MFPVFARYFWVLALAVSVYNFVAASRSEAAYAGLDTAQVARARRLRRRFAVMSIVPWLIMGYGQLIGGVPTVFHYFRPQDRNPYVLAFVASIFVASVVVAIWAVFFGGARTAVTLRLAVFPGASATNGLGEGRIRLIAAAAPLFVIVWVLMATLMDVRVPELPR
jgi:hypothetical protein